MENKKNASKKAENKKVVAAASKKTMNFVRTQPLIDTKKFLPVIIIVFVAVLVLAYFGIVMPLMKKGDATNQLSAKQQQLSDLQTTLLQFSELEDQYGRYSYGWMNEQEVNTVDRMEILDIVSKKIMNKAQVEDFSISGNVLTMNIKGLSLDEVSKLTTELEEDELVEKASIYNATAPEAEQAEITMSIILSKEVSEDENK